MQMHVILMTLQLFMSTFHVKEGGTGQLDRMFKEPEDRRQESLHRIWRNNKIYYAVFYKNNRNYSAQNNENTT